MREIDFRSPCPISSTLDIVGDKWSLLIIRDLCFSEKRTFSEFSESSEGIATNILSERLKKLEHFGIITKSKLPHNKKTNIYSITEKGLDLLPILIEYILWAAKYLDSHIAEDAKQFASELLINKFAIIENIKKKLFLY